jgi:hypothetical protein
MRLRLTNNTSELPLSAFFKMSVSPFIRRTGVKDRYGKDGGRSMGDGRVNPRTISLAYENRPESTAITKLQKDQSYRSQINEITAFFDPINAPWYLYDDDNEIRTEIVMSENSDEPMQDGLTYVLGRNDLKLIMLDGHWEDAEEQVYSQSGVLQSGDIINITNDSLFYCWPVFEFTATNSNTEFSITNSTTGETFTLSSASNTVGAVFTVDGINGTIDLSGVESSISLSDGSGFISLAPGENALLYESAVSGECLFEIKWRRRYAH